MGNISIILLLPTVRREVIETVSEYIVESIYSIKKKILLGKLSNSQSEQ
jgi:hypothetical protein